MTGWYTLASNGQPVGPYTDTHLREFVVQGHLRPESMLWAEGNSEWQPLSAIEELSLIAEQAKDAVELEKLGTGRPKRAPRPKRAADEDYSEFAAEIAALEGAEAAEDGAGQGPGPQGWVTASGAAGATAADVSADGGGDVGAPSVLGAPESPEEKEFEDDDGTWYVWDAKQHKFVPKDADADAAAGLPYNEEDMVFGGVDEKIVSLEAALAAEAAALADSEKNANSKRSKTGATASISTTAAAAAAIPSGEARVASVPEGGAADGAGNAAAVVGADGEAGGDGEGGEDVQVKRPKKKAKKEQGWVELKVNTSVYVTGLPLDVTEAEVAALFSKCGLIKVDEKGQPRVKLYKDGGSGYLKGDGVVTFLKEPSVKLSCDLLDETAFRPGGSQLMRVTPAKFEMKGDAYQAKAAASRAAVKKQLAKLEAASLGWRGFDDSVSKAKATVILKNMFSPEELLEEPLLAEDLERDINAECGKVGKIEKVVVFKTNPEGVVSVRYKDSAQAQACVSLMQGRWFGGKQLSAAIWDGFTNYKVKLQETEEEQQARLDKFARDLEEAGHVDTTVGHVEMTAVQPAPGDPMMGGA